MKETALPQAPTTPHWPL